MSNNQQYRYISLLLLHLGIGALVFLFPFLTKIYSLSVFCFGIYFKLSAILNKKL